MSGTSSFTGYTNEVFQVCMIAVTWMDGQIAAASSPAAAVAQVENTFATLRNGQQAVAAWQLQGAWSTELALLQQIQVLPLTLTAAQSAAFSARITALQNAIPALQALIPAANISNALTLLYANQPAIAYPGVLEFYEAFAFESVPTGFTADETVAYALSASQNWAGIASAILNLQTSIGLTQGYDEVTRITSALSEIYSVCAQIAQASAFSATVGDSPVQQLLWNQNVALPSMLYAASSISSAPSSQVNQQCGVIRTVLGTAINAIALYLLTLRQPQSNNYTLATIQANDSLLDIAARTLGDFEQWTAIAQLNGLTAPWVGEINSEPGASLLIPNANGTTTVTGLPVPSYNTNILGVDWFLGPLNQPMLAWTGDIPLIAGPQNLQISLTRRILTPLASLIYHTNYGSRIPPEVGEVQDTFTANLITAFGKSAIIADPRVASVLSASTTLNATGVGVDAFTAQVQPVGTSGSNGVSVNAVLSPTQ